MHWARLFFPFAGAYFLSYHFRTVNAVVGPVLGAELSLSAAELGLLTSAYFFAFAAAQLPLGILLDRYGARRVESALLLVASAGAALFACGDSIGTLAIARGLIGLGVSACLMAALKSFSQWFSQDRLASLTGWVMTSGTFGALAASTPLDIALQFTSWRGVFAFLAAATALMAAWLFFGLPERTASTSQETFQAQWSGIVKVLTARPFWRFAPVGFAQIGGFMAVQSLWSGAWLIQVNGYTRSQASEHIAAMSIAMMVAYILIGLLATRLARRGIGTLALLSGGMALSLLTLLLIITQVVEQHYALWIAYGVFSSFGTLLYSLAASDFDISLSGRVTTLVNFAAFVGAFGLQWGMGIIIDLAQARGATTANGHEYAFWVLFAIQASALAWLLLGKKRTPTRPAFGEP